jgi:hypothetical protein
MDYSLAEHLLVIILAEKFPAFMEPEPAPKPYLYSIFIWSCWASPVSILSRKPSGVIGGLVRARD